MYNNQYDPFGNRFYGGGGGAASETIPNSSPETGLPPNGPGGAGAPGSKATGGGIPDPTTNSTNLPPAGASAPPPAPPPATAPSLADVQGNPSTYAGTSFDLSRYINPGSNVTGYGAVPNSGAPGPITTPTFAKPAAGPPTGRPANFSLATNDANVWLDPAQGNSYYTPGYSFGPNGIDNSKVYGTDPGDPNSAYKLPSGSYLPNRQTGQLMALNGQ